MREEGEGLTIVEIGMFSDIEIIIYFELFLGCCIMTDIEIEITSNNKLSVFIISVLYVRVPSCNSKGLK